MVHFFFVIEPLMIIPLSTSILFDLHVSYSKAGLILALYTIGACIGSLVCNITANERIERQKIILFLVLSSTCLLITSFTEQFYIFLIMRLLSGLFGGLLSVTNLNYLIRCSRPNQIKRNVAWVLSTFPLALAIGVPFCLTVNSHLGWPSCFMFLAMFLCILSVLFPQSTPEIVSNKASPESKDCHLKIPLEKNSITFISAILTLATAVFGTFLIATQFPVMLMINFAMSNQALSGYYLISGVGAFIAMNIYAKLSFERKRVSVVIFLLTISMIILSCIGFKTSISNIAGYCFVIFIISSSSRTLIINTELIAGLTAEQRAKFTKVQSTIQNSAISAAGLVSTLLCKETTLDGFNYDPLVFVASLVMVSTPFIWLIFCLKSDRKEKSIHEYG